MRPLLLLLLLTACQSTPRHVVDTERLLMMERYTVPEAQIDVAMLEQLPPDPKMGMFGMQPVASMGDKGMPMQGQWPSGQGMAKMGDKMMDHHDMAKPDDKMMQHGMMAKPDDKMMQRGMMAQSDTAMMSSMSKPMHTSDVMTDAERETLQSLAEESSGPMAWLRQQFGASSRAESPDAATQSMMAGGDEKMMSRMDDSMQRSSIDGMPPDQSPGQSPGLMPSMDEQQGMAKTDMAKQGIGLVGGAKAAVATVQTWLKPLGIGPQDPPTQGDCPAGMYQVSGQCDAAQQCFKLSPTLRCRGL